MIIGPRVIAERSSLAYKTSWRATGPPPTNRRDYGPGDAAVFAALGIELISVGAGRRNDAWFPSATTWLVTRPLAFPAGGVITTLSDHTSWTGGGQPASEGTATLDLRITHMRAAEPRRPVIGSANLLQADAF